MGGGRILMLKNLKNQKGSFAIISAVLVFVVILAISAYSDMITKRWTINEVQSVMDASGSNTLKKTVDLDYLRAEILATDENNSADTNQNPENTVKATDYKNKIKQEYVKELKSQIATNDTITELDVQTVEVSFDYDTFGLGESEKPRPQISLDAVTKMKVNSHEFMDNLDGMTADIYSSRNNNTFTVEYAGRTADGQVELVVRSVTRLVYR
jgi:hypothetical protein